MIQLDAVAYEDHRRDRLNAVQREFQSRLPQESMRRLGKLAGLIDKGGVVPFLGAGMSAASGYPTWSGFLRGLARGWVDDSIVSERIDGGDLELLAEDIQNARRAESFEETLEEFNLGYLPSEEIFLVCEMFGNAIVTSNFDPLIENASRQLGVGPEVIEGCGNWSGWAAEGNSSNSQIILKLHGHYKRPNHRVLLKEQYDEAYGDNGAVRRDLQDLHSSKCLLFLGCSLSSDRTMEVARQVQASRKVGSSSRHYAFLAETDNWQEREIFLTDRGIFPIWYPNDDGAHSMIGLMLWWLKDAIASGNMVAH
ncbi:SIR2 family protein [Arthrobacter sp. AQ5-05]|uniref:SIR2 family protein n=1 Tax=Arthrobacter sp. AQ5-05 TaxID=2184581 RepID=UPI0018A74A14|nr:SIR2 family protein [Arthrobacter sp. AQ5-05]